jgi:hypothetical protein
MSERPITASEINKAMRETQVLLKMHPIFLIAISQTPGEKPVLKRTVSLVNTEKRKT